MGVVIPLYDTIPARRFPYVTYVLIAVNVLVFLYQIGLGPLEAHAIIGRWGFTPADITASLSGSGFDPRVMLTLFTAIFIHGGLIHIGGNMLYLHIFGNNVEDAMGSARFIVFYLLIGVVANLAQVVVAPNSGVPGVGASGAIAGVLGAYVLLYPRAGVVTLIPVFFFPLFVTIPALVILGFWFVIQLFQGSVTLVSGTAGAGGVAFWVHAAGFIMGALLITFFRKKELTSGRSWL